MPWRLIFESAMSENNLNHKGRVLAIDTGSHWTNVGYFVDGEQVLEQKITHSPDELHSCPGLMDQDQMRMNAVTTFLERKGVDIADVDIIMGRGGLFAPVRTGVYRVNRDMRDVLLTCRDGVHACNLSAIVADSLSEKINEIRAERGLSLQKHPCLAYIADAPMAAEMLPECRIGGLPEFPRRAFFHALNSRGAVKHYLRDHGKDENDITAVVAHIGVGITITLHRNGEVIDTNNGLGGDGPFTQERAGTCPAFPLVEMCFSGKYTEEEVMRKILGEGGAVAYFGTSDLDDIATRAREGDEDCALFLKAFCLNIAKYIAAVSTTVFGKVDVILLTGPWAYNRDICSAIEERVRFIAPVEVYPGEHSIASLAENGYNVLEGKIKIHRYDKRAIVPDEE